MSTSVCNISCVSEIFKIMQLQWQPLQSKGEIPRGRSGHTCTSIGRQLFLFAGGGESVYFDDLYTCSIDDNDAACWSSPKVSGQTPTARAYHGAVQIGTKLIVFGGWKGDQFLNDLHVLDGVVRNSGTLRWTQPQTIGETASPRAYHTCTAVDQKMLVFGGWFMKFCNDLLILDTENMEWKVQPVSGAVPAARAAHTATLIGHRLFIFGGESQNGRLNDTWVLDTNTMHWSQPTTVGKPPSSRSGHSAGAVGEWLVIFGGWDGDQHLHDLILLHSRRMEWVETFVDEKLHPAPLARSGHVCLSINNSLYLQGGWDRETFLDDTWNLRLPRTSTESIDLSDLHLTRRQSNDSNTTECRERRISMESTKSPLLELVRRRGQNTLEQLTEWAALKHALGMPSLSTEPSGYVAGLVVDIAAALVERTEMELAEEAGGREGQAEDGARLDGEGASKEPVASAHREHEEAGPPSLQPSHSSNALDFALRAEEEMRVCGDLGQSAESTSGSRIMGPLLHEAQCRSLLPSASKLNAELTNELHISKVRRLGFWPSVDGPGEVRRWKGSSESGDGTEESGCRQCGGKAVRAPGGSWREAPLGAQAVAYLVEVYREEFKELASKVDVQALFRAHAELVRIQNSIRSHGLSGAPHKGLMGVAMRDELHHRCQQLAELLRGQLEALISKQRRRSRYLRKAVKQLSDSVRQLQTGLYAAKAGSAPFGSREGPECKSHVDALPEFFMESDSMAALVSRMEKFKKLEDVHRGSALYAAHQNTDRAIRALWIALGEEEQIALRCTEKESINGPEGQGVVADLASTAEGFVQQLLSERGGDVQELEHTQSLLMECIAMADKLQLIQDQRKDVSRLQHRSSELANSLLASRTEVIRCNAVVELQRLHNPGSRELHVAEENLKQLQISVDAQTAEQKVINEQLAELAREEHPELLCQTEGEGQLNFTGLTHELNLLWTLHHPAIIAVEAVFRAGPSAYIQMPYINGGTLGEWLEKRRPKPWELQSVFRQLLQGLAYLHDHNITHRHLSPDNVLMAGGDSLGPIICDFSFSKINDEAHLLDCSRTSSLYKGFCMTGAHTGGSYGYLAPEALGGEASPSLDMWAVGVMLYKAVFHEMPRMDPSASGALIPPHENEHLCELLQGLLQVDPEKRLNGNEALAMRYCTSSFIRHFYENKQILDSDAKLELLREHVHSLQEGRAAVNIRVRREHLISDVIAVFSEMEKDALYFPLKVRFIGEAGIDAGGLTSELYTDFFNRAVEFTNADGMRIFEAPAEEDRPLSGGVLLPSLP
ncbi:hypothetical protein CYMTET_10602 [Cymbomonas tetramitiformis]|uniref:Protein kinase domain-containing protein n=1 Tax=Cymbomonas tetramitiformis TaxID=36881 RepID=A0AAE0GP54_9CHLO|nr:hypothetical protein CYMTET_10602 [Cymbomonas tetramitiformis]